MVCIIGVCDVCGKDAILHHHTKYIETHGEDETVLLCMSCHVKIDHRKLFPNKSREQIREYSIRAHNNSGYHKDYVEKHSGCYVLSKRKYYMKNRDTVIKRSCDYEKANVVSMTFHDNITDGFYHRERLRYNTKTHNIIIDCGFGTDKKHKLIYIDTKGD